MKRASVVMAGLLLAAGCKERPAAPAAQAPASDARPTPTLEPGAPPEIDRKTPLPDPLPAIAARVNGEPIATRHVKVYAETALNNGAIPREERIYAYRYGLQQLIVRELLFQEAVARGVEADTKAIEEEENKIRAKYPNEAQWADFLAKQGLTPATYKTELRTQFTVNRLAQGEYAKASGEVSDAELEQFYKENDGRFRSTGRVSISHILLRAPTDTHKQARRTLAESLLKQLREGADFAELARKHSQDIGSAGKGGRLDAFGRGEMPPALKPIDDAVAKLQPGELSDIVATEAGLHIIRLDERLPDRTLPLEAVREGLRRHLSEQKRQEAVQKLINQLRAKAKIETFL